jgi:drug/metabolite transporter (DMT)-like permease
MLAPGLFSPAYSLAAVAAWGTADFLGGYAARRGNAYLLTVIVYGAGLILMTSIAAGIHAPFPARTAVIWALAAGCFAGVSLALFYRALAVGKMGLAAPITSVLAAAIPTSFGIFTEGFPGFVRIAGFVLAIAGIWLISRPQKQETQKGIGLAVLSGLGFAGFFLCIKGAGSGSALWISAISRWSSVLVAGLIVLLWTQKPQIARSSMLIGIAGGCLDVTGSALFVRAIQTGRLDSAVVLTSLYPAVTVLLARIFLKEHFTRWKTVGIFAALVAVPLIAFR